VGKEIMALYLELCNGFITFNDNAE